MVESFTEFLQMGGYAKYVWPSYAIVATLFCYHYIAPIVERRKLIQELHIETSEQAAIHTSNESELS